MPTSTNKGFKQKIPIPEGIGPNTEVFYIKLTNEVFEDYDEYFERIFELNSSHWVCTITGKSGLTYEEALNSENDAIDTINNFPAFLEVPILFLVHRFTCRARVDELVGDVMAFMRDRYFMDEEIVYRHKKGRKRKVARVIGIHYNPERAGGGGVGTVAEKQPLQNGTPKTPIPSSNKTTPATKTTKTSPLSKSASKAEAGMELCPADCFLYDLQILHQEGDSETETSSGADESGDDGEKEGGGGEKGQVFSVPHALIGRGKANYATKPRIKLFLRYYSEMAPDGRLVLKRSSIEDFMISDLSWEQVFTDCPGPKFPQTRSNKKIKSTDRLALASPSGAIATIGGVGGSMEERKKRPYHRKNQENIAAADAMQQPSTSRQSQYSTGGSAKSAGAASARAEGLKRKQIAEQQLQLEPLFEKAEQAGVENMGLWRQSVRLLSEDNIQALRTAIAEAKEAQRKRKVEAKRKEREALIEWRKPRDDLLCDDLQPFPAFQELLWPDWVPRDLYWDALSIQSFLHTFAEVLFKDGRNPFSLVKIAMALVSRQVSDNAQLYELLDWLMSAMKTCIVEDEGNPADLSRPEQLGNEREAAKEFEHPVHGEKIKRINKDCEHQKKIHGVHVHAFSRDHLTITEGIRLHLLTSGFYTQYRRQKRGQMHCWEDDGYVFVPQEQEIMRILRKSSVFALNPQQRVRLVNVLINQLLSFRRLRELMDRRTEELAEMKRDLKHMRAVDLQHDREAREALQTLVQQQQAKIGSSAATDNGETPANGIDKAKLKELAHLRRALIQLNEGRRVQNIMEIRERLVDEENSLPWAQMETVSEIQEFRNAQRNFHGDKVLELLQRIYELQGKMGLFYLGRDRAFRSYYYICSAFVIYCPAPEELGHCGQPTPISREMMEECRAQEEKEEEEEKASKEAAKNDEEDEEEEDDGIEIIGEVKGKDDEQKGEEKKKKNEEMNDEEGKKKNEEKNDDEKEGKKNEEETMKKEEANDDDNDIGRKKKKTTEEDDDDVKKKEEDDVKMEEEKMDDEGKNDAVKKKKENSEDDNKKKKVEKEKPKPKTPKIDRLMACTGGRQQNQKKQCPVHNPPREWPRLLYYMERDAVKKLIDALNLRGFRETELAENISMFREIYTREMADAVDLLEERRNQTQLPISAQIFGFSSSLPKELVRDQAEESQQKIADRLLGEVCKQLLDIEEIIFERNVGKLHCTIGRDQWRTILTEHFANGDTSPFCVDNRVPVLHSLKADDLLYTPEELANPEALTPVQKLGIALLQIVHGVRVEYMQSPFMSETKKNGAVIKRTPNQTFVEWQRALKTCKSPSAVALFETTFEFAVDWQFAEQQQQRQQKQESKAGRRRQPKQVVENGGGDQPSTSSSSKSLPPTAHHHLREAEQLIQNANYAGLLVTGTRQRKPVTKYGECEMDLDKLDFEDEEEEEKENKEESEEEEDSEAEEGRGRRQRKEKPTRRTASHPQHHRRSEDEEEEEEEEEEEDGWNSDDNEEEEEGGRGGKGRRARANAEDNDEEEEEDEPEDDEPEDDEDEAGPSSRQNLRHHSKHHHSKHHQQHQRIEHFDGYGAVRYEGLGLRKRKAVTHFDPTSYHNTNRKREKRGEDDYYDYNGEPEEEEEGHHEQEHHRGHGQHHHREQPVDHPEEDEDDEQEQYDEEEEENGHNDEQEEDDEQEEEEQEEDDASASTSRGGREGTDIPGPRREIPEWQQFG